MIQECLQESVHFKKCIRKASKGRARLRLQESPSDIHIVMDDIAMDFCID